MFDLIAKTKHNGVILLSGNAHFAELSKIEADAGSPFELTSSGMTPIYTSCSRAANRYRISGPFTEHNFFKRMCCLTEPGSDRLS